MTKLQFVPSDEHPIFTGYVDPRGVGVYLNTVLGDSDIVEVDDEWAAFLMTSQPGMWKIAKGGKEPDMNRAEPAPERNR